MINQKFDAFFNGECFNAYELFGVFKQGNGVRFTMYAPHAHKVAVITSKDSWSQEHFLNKIDDRGVYELYIDDMEIIYSYRYRLYKNDHYSHDKIDPYAYYNELRPSNASVMYDLSYYRFSDDKFMQARQKDLDQAMNIYEVHVNGFMRPEWKKFASYQDLKEHLIPYVKHNGFTHIELMPLMEHPFDGSWGYQCSSFYSITSRYGSPYDLMDFINECHLNGIKVIFDVVYTHFVKDDYALVNFDHQALYEYPNPYQAKSEWDTFYFDVSNPTVMSYLMSSACFYAKHYHVDGFRFDAISHFIHYRGNKDLGENKEGINFLKKLNYELNKLYPSLMLIAEDSSDFPNVTKKVEHGGLGFDLKWDLGWMNDTLKYYAMDHEYRKYHHQLMTFSMAYFYNENFVLPLSHDEVVHMKKSIVDKMFGSFEEKFSLAKNLYVYMFTHPGKKLNFMGNELALFSEFNEAKELEWFMLRYPRHDSFQRFFRDLSRIYQYHPCLWEKDYDWSSFRWIEVDNHQQSIFSYYREDDKQILVTVLNMLPVSYQQYKVGVPLPGQYVEILNTEKDIYNGCNMCNYQPIDSQHEEFTYQHQHHSISIDIAPLSAIIFRIEK